MRRSHRWRRYGFEFLSIFIAVVAAFALNNWNENRREARAAEKILAEIANGLELDERDIDENTFGHELGIKACTYWQKLIRGDSVALDSFPVYNFMLLRDYFTLQNNSGYATLQSKGLEIITNDSLRKDIIALYEYHYVILQKMEEAYEEGQFFKSYFHRFNEQIGPHLIFDDNGRVVSIQTPLALPVSEQRKLLNYLYRIYVNRLGVLTYYRQVKAELIALRHAIRVELGTEEANDSDG